MDQIRFRIVQLLGFAKGFIKPEVGKLAICLHCNCVSFAIPHAIIFGVILPADDIPRPRSHYPPRLARGSRLCSGDPLEGYAPIIVECQATRQCSLSRSIAPDVARSDSPRLPLETEKCTRAIIPVHPCARLMAGYELVQSFHEPCGAPGKSRCANRLAWSRCCHSLSHALLPIVSVLRIWPSLFDDPVAGAGAADAISSVRADRPPPPRRSRHQHHRSVPDRPSSIVAPNPQMESADSRDVDLAICHPGGSRRLSGSLASAPLDLPRARKPQQKGSTRSAAQAARQPPPRRRERVGLLAELAHVGAALARASQWIKRRTVSYTHLTLPTILRV